MGRENSGILPREDVFLVLEDGFIINLCRFVNVLVICSGMERIVYNALFLNILIRRSRNV